MMSRHFLFIAVFLVAAGNAQGQKYAIKEIKSAILNKATNTADSNIKYPIIQFGSKSTSDRINRTIRRDFYGLFAIDSNKTLKEAVDSAIEGGLTYVDCKVAFCNDNVLSIQIGYEIGAFSDYKTSYYNFSNEGINLKLTSIINQPELKNFKALVQQKQTVNIQIAIADLVEKLEKEEIDSSNLRAAKEAMKYNCLEHYEDAKFIISEKVVTVIVECNFPPSIETLTPNTDIIFTKAELKNILNGKYLF